MAIIVPAVLLGLAIAVMLGVSIVATRKGKHREAAPAQQSNQPRILVHDINDDRCVGCDACVAVCPTNVLDLVDNKSRVLRFEDCIQCEACMWACPTEALVMHLEGTEPPPLKVPNINPDFETPVQGQYLIGEVAGKPLVKNAANLGRMVVEHMLVHGLQKGAISAPEPNVQAVDVAIVGSGPAGLSTALTCIHRGLSYVVLEKEQLVASTISRYPKGKLVMAEPYDVTNRSFLPVFDSSKEEIIPIWEDLMGQVGLEVKKGEAVEEIGRQDDGVFHIRTTVAQYRSQRVVLATGTRGKPRTLGVQGENLPKVHSLLEDPDDHQGRSVLVVGGGDSALEAAIALADAGATVTLSYRGKSFARASPKNKATIESYGNQRRAEIHYQSQVDHLTESTAVLNLSDGSQKEVENDAAFVLIGADPPIKWLEKMGVNYVEKPHQFQLGKTDQNLIEMLGDQAQVCAENAAGAAALLRGEKPAEAQPERPQEATGARKWLRSATAIFTTQKKIDEPMPLSEFAKQRRHTGHGRRDMLDPAERTRVLRMLRDVGGRMADEESESRRAGKGAPANPVHDDRMRQAGLRGPTYPAIDVPNLPGVADMGKPAQPGAPQAQAGAPAGTMLGVAGSQPPAQQGQGGGHGLHAASQLRAQAKQQGRAGAPDPNDAKTIVQMTVPPELLKHSVGARRRAEQAPPAPTANRAGGNPPPFMADDEKTQMAPPPSMDGSPPAPTGARTMMQTPAAQGGSPDNSRTLFDPGAQHAARGAPQESQRKTLFNPGAPAGGRGGQGGNADQGSPPDNRRTLFDPGAQPGGPAPRAPTPGGQVRKGQGSAPDDRQTLFDPGAQHGTGGGQGGQRRTLFNPGSQAPARAGEAPRSSGRPPRPQEHTGEQSRRALADKNAQAHRQAREQRDPNVDARHTLRSVNVQFGDEATTAADVSELVRKMSEERQKRDKRDDDDDDRNKGGKGPPSLSDVDFDLD